MKRCLPAVIAAGVLLAGCSAPPQAPQSRQAQQEPHVAHAPQPRQPPPSRPGTGAAFNDTDVMFLQMMVPHHEQGITLARLAKEKATSGDIRTLAAAIESTQATELRAMAGWLRDWRQPPTAPADSHAAHGGMPQTSRTELDVLRTATGTEFDRQFGNVMIAHQDDAIQLARMEISTGTNPDARHLAGLIDRSRTAQIDQLLTFLGQR
jgi:uncharacterized protein (DUF305 family)